MINFFKTLWPFSSQPKTNNEKRRYNTISLKDDYYHRLLEEPEFLKKNREIYLSIPNNIKK
jgi:hypothetical protein